MIKKIVASNWLVLIICLFVVTINTAPNIFAYLNTPEGFVFSGQASWFDPWDINVYVAAVKFGQCCGILLQNSYTTSQHQPILMYPIYTIAGRLFPEANPFLIFHLLAILTGVLLIITIKLMIKIFTGNDHLKNISLLLIVLGGGLGWLFFPNIPSADLFVTGFTFISQFQRSHEALGVMFYLISLTLVYQSTVKQSFLQNLLSLLFALITIIFYPFYTASFLVIALLFNILYFFKTTQSKQFIYWLFNLIILGIAVYFYYVHLQTSSGFSGVLNQQLEKISITSILLGYGFILPLTIIQLFRAKQGFPTIFLNIWWIASLLLSFLPLGFARFYLRGLFLPLVLLVILNLDWYHKILRIPKKILIIILLTLLPISSFYITYRRLSEVSNNNPWYFLSSDQSKALTYLKTKAWENCTVIASSYPTANMIPSHTSCRVYFGHLLQTPKAKEKSVELAKFYSNNFSETEAGQFLSSNSIHYIYLERGKLTYPFLKKEFQSNDIVIFSSGGR